MGFLFSYCCSLSISCSLYSQLGNGIFECFLHVKWFMMTWWDTLMLILSKFYFIFYPCTFSFSIHVIVVIIIFCGNFFQCLWFLFVVLFSHTLEFHLFFGGGIVGCSKQLALNVISCRIWFVCVLFEGAKNAIAESVCVCVKNANVASKAYKWDGCYICG